ncbi:hypothetical protein [Ferrimonas aestuarii]|uniref:Uncharacterized protein n=1 Tax=Ferrimonas aestuarii TaxID=2569539 RepID=A0A4U1BLA4_9GAMM|nr:hypothetical protein [Ferrimonas aestuarii]TKB53344.1 hypothetical protein FCL42_14865 [Ferrimonas aestuarii]
MAVRSSVAGDVVYGLYGSGEFAANLGVPMPQAHIGGELSVYPTFDYEAALDGKFMIYGGEFDANLATFSAGLVNTNDGRLTGFQTSLLFSTPNLAKPLPLHSGFVRGGEGVASDVFSFNYKNWWD